MADPLAVVNADVAKVVAWYKAKTLYVGLGLGFILGLILEHFVKA